MPFYHILLLSIIQGLTEFLPVSSSGHLVITHVFLEGGTQDLCWTQNRMIDIAVHVGTLLSVLLYFRHDLLNMACNITNKNSDGFNMIRNIIIASLPVIIAGFILNHYEPSFLCMIKVMAWTTLIFGVVLWIADRFEYSKSIEQMSSSNAFLIGLSQTLALIPGVSRSGITMTSARFLGFTRVEAARFSLLLSIIAISGAGILKGVDLIQTDDITLGFDVLIAVVLSFFTGWISILFMMKWLSNATFTPFAIYRIVLGFALLGLIYSGVI